MTELKQLVNKYRRIERYAKGTMEGYSQKQYPDVYLAAQSIVNHCNAKIAVHEKKLKVLEEKAYKEYLKQRAERDAFQKTNGEGKRKRLPAPPDDDGHVDNNAERHN